MDITELNYYYNKFKYGEDIFHTLMQKRVKEILLVSTFYDAFIFEQDGRLAEQIFGEFHRLNLTYPSRITSVPTGEEALRKIDEVEFDLVITMMRIGDITPFELSRRIKQKYPNLPVLLLLNVQSDIARIDKNSQEMQYFNNVFLWNGDPQIFLAMIKYVEDLQNVAHDTAVALVRVVLLVEDSIYFYSRFLPMLFREMMLQTQLLISEELNDMQKNYRMRTRPKVLMAHTFEEAITICRQYKEYLLCVISDIRFPQGGRMDSEAGVKLINYLKSHDYDVSILLQSSDNDLAQTAKDLNVSFLHKSSESLLTGLSNFVHTNLGFGDFVFRDARGREIGRVKSLSELEQKLLDIPDESLLYHGKRNHFSTWLLARGEIQVARDIRPLQLEDFGGSVEKERQHLMDVFRNVRSRKNKGSIIDFDSQNLDEENEIVRLSDGSLGGKGRGIAFLNALLVTMEFEDRFKDMKIKIPKTAFIGTGEFDLFMRNNHLRENMDNIDDEHIKTMFLEARLSPKLREKLALYVKHINTPLAVRSSGLLEDSQSQTFAGIYQTFMLPNNHPDRKIRQKQLENAIKLVYASTFLKDARTYIERIHYRMEEEKMAVIIQEIVGDVYGDLYYPHFSGVAQSYNYYPTSYMEHSDGFASVALGLGQWVVDGEKVYRFCPKYPDLQILSPEELLKNSQTAFYALNMETGDIDLTQGGTATLSRVELNVAEEDGVLKDLASVWDQGDRRIRNGLSSSGPRVMTFANILKYKRFPLADILIELLDIGEKALGVPVEIEFAVTLTKNLGKNIFPTFYILQIRPFYVHAELTSMAHDEIDRDNLLLYTEQGMGNGVISTIYDLIYLDLETFDNTKTLNMKEEIQALNEHMIAEDREYILIGPGRWGSRDRFLGIPVKWAHINKARVIVESGTRDFIVEASQGTHFFHNLVTMNTGYFTVPFGSTRDFVDWDWLRSQKPLTTTKYFTHIRRETPLTVKMFGKKGVAVIYK